MQTVLGGLFLFLFAMLAAMLYDISHRPTKLPLQHVSNLEDAVAKVCKTPIWWFVVHFYDADNPESVEQENTLEKVVAVTGQTVFLSVDIAKLPPHEAIVKPSLLVVPLAWNNDVKTLAYLARYEVSTYPLDFDTTRTWLHSFDPRHADTKSTFVCRDAVERIWPK